jgi:hypothetical protein
MGAKLDGIAGSILIVPTVGLVVGKAAGFSDYVEIKRFGANPTHVVGELNCYSMPTSGKFGVFDEHTRRSWPCMCEYSSREVYSQASISDTKGVYLNSCIGRGLKPYSYIDW